MVVGVTSESWTTHATSVGYLLTDSRSERGELEPVGPSAFWKTSNDEQTTSSLSDILPNGFMAYSALLEMDPDPEGDMDYATGDDDGDDDDDPLDFDTIEGELPALLLDAELGLLGVPIEDEEDNGDDTDDTAV